MKAEPSSVTGYKDLAIRVAIAVRDRRARRTGGAGARTCGGRCPPRVVRSAGLGAGRRRRRRCRTHRSDHEVRLRWGHVDDRGLRPRVPPGRTRTGDQAGTGAAAGSVHDPRQRCATRHGGSGCVQRLGRRHHDPSSLAGGRGRHPPCAVDRRSSGGHRRCLQGAAAGAIFAIEVPFRDISPANGCCRRSLAPAPAT